MEIVYAQERHALTSGQSQRNPRFFNGAEGGVTRVVLVGAWPDIEDAYLARGVVVSHHGRPDLDRQPATVGLITKQAEDPALVDIPADWIDLPWTRADEGRTSLRHLASAVSAEPVLNRNQAKAAIRAELARRAPGMDPLDIPQPDANGLTMRELHADLTALGVQWEPDATPAQLLAERDEARMLAEAG